MKTALLHYWLLHMRGGENVLAEFCRIFPDADIFTHAFRRAAIEEPICSHRVFETMIARLPGARKNCQKYLPLMPYALKKLDLNDYDLLLSSESGPAKGVRKRPGAIHICYCHTPMRYLWDMFDDYYAAAGIAGKAAMKIFKNPLRRYDLHSAEGVDYFIANSAFVAERIRRIYNREAAVIHPPVDADYFRPGKPVEKGDFHLFTGQLVRYKRADLAVKACLKRGEKLVVAGTGPQLEELKHLAYGNSSIVFTGRTDRERLRELYARAKTLIFPGIEDFGIVPLEAQAAGTPVVALGKGGALETVLPGKTGVFFNEPDVVSLSNALEEAKSVVWDVPLMQAHARTFSPARFRREITNFIEEKTGEKISR